MARQSSPGSVYSVSSGSGAGSVSAEASDYASDGSPDPPARSRLAKRPRLSGPASRTSSAKTNSKNGVIDIEDSTISIHRPHAFSYHSTASITESNAQNDLLEWFESVREKRGMPWRKRYNATLSIEEKGQRAYEIWVSEVMLQQTQVNTVIAYWTRWIEKWPTIKDLAKADIEEVNSAWRGLGYYRRARSLLEGAKTVMAYEKYKGRLPNDPDVLEKEVSGVGRYTAGAICSMAYGIRTPIVDGNIHRLFTRLLAVHGPQTAPSTIKFLWAAAEEMVDKLPKDGRKGLAGDWNQALMELGSQVCKPVAPTCSECPLKTQCKAFAETTTAPPPATSTEDQCDLCAPIPSTSETTTIPAVTIFPMRKEKKVSRVEDEVVCITERRYQGKRSWLFVKRPEKGLLAGLFEPPTTPVPVGSNKDQRCETALESVALLLNLPKSDITSHRDIGSIPHIFSHINMTYHIQHLIIESQKPPADTTDGRAVWLDEQGVEHANVGTGVKKVWAEVFGSWGSFEVGASGQKDKKVKAKPKPKPQVKVKAEDEVKKGGKVVKKVSMPAMPKRKALDPL